MGNMEEGITRFVRRSAATSCQGGGGNMGGAGAKARPTLAA